MDKITFRPADDEAPVEFYVISETRFGGRTYLLVSDVDPDGEEDGEALILRDDSEESDAEALFTVVEEDEEAETLMGVFSELLIDEDFELKE
ncbi:MAG: DUF1292 domain-containing protein [Lachnospiraceae bacterium]|jgi:hypothetical protein|nr:DUF1292 domain-containing protein [Lachnospiraceae bacterium]